MVVERIREFGVNARAAGGDLELKIDRVAAEEPLEIRIDGIPLAVVMRTPGDDIDLGMGFLYAEEIITSADDVGTIAHCRSGADPDLENVIDVKLMPGRRSAADQALKRAERTTITSSSCGVCGKRTIESLQAGPRAQPFSERTSVDLDLVQSLPGRLRRAQAVFEETGGLHAAAVFDQTGEIRVVREDVGRHNAVDKCVGRLLVEEAIPAQKHAILFVSGRTSFEIVQKALLARIRTVASVSAPSSLAIELARASNMALLGFVREGRLNQYSPLPESG